jgi:hypothetical protein
MDFLFFLIGCCVALPCALRLLTTPKCTCCKVTRKDRKSGVAYILERGRRPVSWYGECDGCMGCERHPAPEPDEARYVVNESAYR